MQDVGTGESLTENILGYRVYRESLDASVRAITEWIQKGKECRTLACINPHSYVLSLKDLDFSTALHEADWLVPDGAGIVYASKYLRGSITTRITGSDIFAAVNAALVKQKFGSVFFLGSTEATLELIRKKMAADFPCVKVAGSYSPPFKEVFSKEDNDAMIAAVNQAKPDVLWVGMTSPKQDIWIFENRHRLQVKFAAGVGAVFDFYTGQIKRSHPVFQKLGLEWLPRLLQDPKRLWKRMFISAPVFLWHLYSTKRLTEFEA
ncbi:MAG: WecB/TagA/CpsF family glycosyltransferase [Chlorobium sp.]|nr:MAG: WecB/TagA/CpsF family glycosyltransferase [Chlorobium sp.]